MDLLAFACIGLCDGDTAPTEDLLGELADGAELRLPASGSADYVIWRAPDGASVWFLVEAADPAGVREIADVAAFFEGDSDVSATFVSANTDGSWSLASPLHRGETIVVSAVDRAAHRKFPAHHQVRLRLVLFARHLAAASAETSDLVADHPAAARVVGRLTDRFSLVNAATGLPYEWLVVDAGPWTIDVVAPGDRAASVIGCGEGLDARGLLVARLLDRGSQ
jgi:hypothetical protein